MSGRLKGNRLSARRQRDEVNPMDGVANLADCMLVLACGLLLSLIMHWNVDFKPQQVEISDEMTEIEDFENKAVDDPAAGAGFEERGKVYYDPDSGKMYYVENVPEEGGTDQDTADRGATDVPIDQNGGTDEGTFNDVIPSP